MKIQSILHYCSLWLLLSTACFAAKSDTIASYGDTVLEAEEIAAEIGTMAPSQLEVFTRSARSRQNLAAEFLMRRQVAALARKQGIADDPVFQRRLKLLEERLLYQMYMQRAEAEKLDEKIAEQMAYDEYRAYKSKFVSPEAVRASHILLRIDDNDAGRDRAQTEELVQKLLERLRAGEDFAKLAKEHSEDPGSARKGGDLGFVERGRMAKPFEEAAFALRKSGDLSDIVETQFGLHIIRLTDRREGGQRPFDEVRDELVKVNRNRLRSKIRQDIAAPFRDPARLKVDDAAMEALFTAE